MRLLFWNMGRNDNAALALECMRIHGVGVAAFAEYSGIEFSDELLRGTGYRVVGMGGCDKIVMLADVSIDVANNFEASRFTVFALESPEARFVVAATHLVDRISASDPEARLEDIRELMDVVHGYEDGRLQHQSLRQGASIAQCLQCDALQRHREGTVFKDLAWQALPVHVQPDSALAV